MDVFFFLASHSPQNDFFYSEFDPFHLITLWKSLEEPQG